jgi:hypothetical protein
MMRRYKEDAGMTEIEAWRVCSALNASGFGEYEKGQAFVEAMNDLFPLFHWDFLLSCGFVVQTYEDHEIEINQKQNAFATSNLTTIR